MFKTAPKASPFSMVTTFNVGKIPCTQEPLPAEFKEKLKIRCFCNMVRVLLENSITIFP
jgi:hypothetical protein